MQFIDLAAQQARIRGKIDIRITKVLNSGKYMMGPEVKEIEKVLAEYAGAKYALGCSSGTDALLIPLMAYDVKPGDAIFTTPFTFIATAEVIRLLGATPVFVDIDPVTFNIDPVKLKEVVAATVAEGKLRVKGIIPVDLFGQPADYDAIQKVADAHNMFVLEDAAQSFGATYKGKRTCSLTETAATSFFPAKPLGCYGDGGMAFTNNEELYAKFCSIRVHGKGSDKYDNVRVGINGRLDTIQAAILLEKAAIFEDESEIRQEVAARYAAGLKDVVTVPVVAEGNVSAWAQYSVLHDDRQGMMDRLKAQGIPTAVYYPKPLHLQTAFADLGYTDGAFPISEAMSQKIFSLPFHPYLSKEDQQKIIDVMVG